MLIGIVIKRDAHITEPARLCTLDFLVRRHILLTYKTQLRERIASRQSEQVPDRVLVVDSVCLLLRHLSWSKANLVLKRESLRCFFVQEQF